MNPQTQASAQIAALHDIETWLRNHEEERGKLNTVIFGLSNRMRVHPHDLSLYICIRTASL